MKGVLLTIMIFASYIYYAITYILGFNNGTMSEQYFSITIGVVFAVVVIYSFYQAIKNRILYINIKSFLIIFFLIVSLLLYNNSDKVLYFKIVSVVYIFPSIFYGIFCLDRHLDIKKHLIFMMYIFTLCLVPYIINYINGGITILRNGFGSGTYQNAGYCFAYAYVINLFLYNKKKIIKIPLLLLQFTGCVTSTASGAFVACIIATIIYYFDYIKCNGINLKNWFINYNYFFFIFF